MGARRHRPRSIKAKDDPHLPLPTRLMKFIDGEKGAKSGQQEADSGGKRVGDREGDRQRHHAAHHERRRDEDRKRLAPPFVAPGFPSPGLYLRHHRDRLTGR